MGFYVEFKSMRISEEYFIHYAVIRIFLLFELLQGYSRESFDLCIFSWEIIAMLYDFSPKSHCFLAQIFVLFLLCQFHSCFILIKSFLIKLLQEILQMFIQKFVDVGDDFICCFNSTLN